jgi:hypothetical protein
VTPSQRNACRKGSQSYARAPCRRPGLCRPGPGLPPAGGVSVRAGGACVTSLTSAAATAAFNGTPRASAKTWCSLPDLPRSVGSGPAPSPPGGLGKGGVAQGPPPVDLAGAVELGQQRRVQLPPDAGLAPGAQAVPAGLATTAAQLGGQAVPGDAGLQHGQDARQGLAVTQRLAAGEAEAAPRGGGSKRRTRSPSASLTSGLVAGAPLLVESAPHKTMGQPMCQWLTFPERSKS